MQVARLFEFNEIATLASGLVLVASYLWMKWKVPDYRFAHLNSPRPMLGLVEAYRQSPRPEGGKDLGVRGSSRRRWPSFFSAP